MEADRDVAQHWRGRQAVVVEVLEAKGSTPREAGTRMLVGAQDAAGTIGGGHLELEALRLAREALGGSRALPLRQTFSLGPALGQCCGGTVTLELRALDDAEVEAWPQGAALFHLQLFGAGHVGRAIIEVLSTLPCRVEWIDERAAEFPRQALAPHIECVCVDSVEAEVAVAPAGSLVLVMTHSHSLDLAIVEAALRRGDFGYVGVIGSRAKRARFVKQLEAKGVDPSRLVCPVGVEGVVSKQPSVIAVAVVAQLLQHARRA